MTSASANSSGELGVLFVRDDETGFAPDVKDAFYRSLANDFTESQVIIFENEDPPSDISGIANVIRFTGTATGRNRSKYSYLVG